MYLAGEIFGHRHVKQKTTCKQSPENEIVDILEFAKPTGDGASDDMTVKHVQYLLMEEET